MIRERRGRERGGGRWVVGAEVGRSSVLLEWNLRLLPVRRTECRERGSVPCGPQERQPSSPRATSQSTCASTRFQQPPGRTRESARSARRITIEGERGETDLEKRLRDEDVLLRGDGRAAARVQRHQRIPSSAMPFRVLYPPLLIPPVCPYVQRAKLRGC